jgi:hypothetical protein
MIAREQIVAAARASMGTPYHHQASVKGVAANAANASGAQGRQG